MKDMTVQKRTTAETMRALNAKDFLSFGINQISYIKPVTIKESTEEAWVIHAADGKPLSVVETMEEAMAASWQNDLKPVRLH